MTGSPSVSVTLGSSPTRKPWEGTTVSSDTNISMAERQRGGALARGCAVTALVASLSATLPAPRRSS